MVIQAPGFAGGPSRGHRSSAVEPRLLDRVLGEVEVAEDPDQGGDRPSRLSPEQAVDGSGVGLYDAARAASPVSSEANWL